MSLHDYDKYELENALPDYKYVRCIGEGAYGTVYLLEEKETKEMFAVKRVT
jgi:serine/threonine protein kinase